MFRRARLRQRRVLELAAISTLLAVILMTSMQTLIQIPYYASAQLTPTSLQESGITPITPTTVSSPLGGQPIVPASSDTIDDMTENMTDPLQNTSLSNITQQATIDSALAGHLPVPVSTAGCVSLCAAISDETIGNGGVVGGNGVIVSNGGNVGGDGDGSNGGGDGDGSNGGGDGDGSNGGGDGDGSNGDGGGSGGDGDGSNGDGGGSGGDGDGSNGDGGGSGGDGDGSNGGGDGDGSNGGGDGDGSNGGGDGDGSNGGGGGSGGDGDGSNGGGGGERRRWRW